MTEIISREEALARGLTRYFTGKPCRAGHVAERHSADGGCVECQRIRHRASPEKNKERYRRWRKANLERARDAERRWRETHPEKAKESRRRWREANPEKFREYGRRRRSAAKAAQQITEQRHARDDATGAELEIEHSGSPGVTPKVGNSSEP